MKQITGNLFNQLQADAICITTNGFVKNNGEAVMGMGCAKTAKDAYPQIAKNLGTHLETHGNCVGTIAMLGKAQVLSFPVKPAGAIATEDNVVSWNASKFPVGTNVPGFACKADLEIIERSALQLAHFAAAEGLSNIIIPRPGCGAGELTWEVVEPVLSQILDDRFSIITFK